MFIDETVDEEKMPLIDFEINVNDTEWLWFGLSLDLYIYIQCIHSPPLSVLFLSYAMSLLYNNKYWNGKALGGDITHEGWDRLDHQVDNRGKKVLVITYDWAIGLRGVRVRVW